MVKRIAAALALMVALLVGGGGAAMAAGGPVDPNTPAGAKGGISIPNPVGGLGDAILEKICPQRQAPYPQSPEMSVVNRGGGPGTYAQRGYAGTFWTTFDEGCVSMGKVDTALAVNIENIATSVDSLVNEMQVMALDRKTTTAFDPTIAAALKGLADAFWLRWVLVGTALVGFLIALAVWSGRLGAVGSHMARALLILTVVTGIVSTPTLIFNTADKMTAGVTNGVAASLMSVTHSKAMPDSATPSQKFAEAYYQITHQSWLEGSFCGDESARARYGDRLLAAQSFSVAESKGATAALAKAKQDDWVKIGKEMKQSNPVGFSCWKGASSSRTSAATKHAIVSVSAGFWVGLGSLVLLALKWLLRVGMLFMVTFGAAMMFSQRLADKMIGVVMVGLVGPLFVAAGVGTLLWGYYAILLTPGQAWWQAGILAFALGFGLFMAKGMIGSLFEGVQHVADRAGSYGRKGRRVAMGYSRGTSAAGATLAGGIAGAAVALHERHDRKQEKAKQERGSAGYAGFAEDSRREQAVASIQRPEVPDSVRAERAEQDKAAGYYLANARRAAQARGATEVVDPMPPTFEPVPFVVDPQPRAPEPEPVPAPVTPKPEERAPEMEHGSVRASHAPLVEREQRTEREIPAATERRAANWRAGRMGEALAQDDAAHAKAAPVVARTFTGSDSRRADLPPA